MGRGWSPERLSDLRRFPAIPPFDLLVVAIIIAVAEVEIWVPSGVCIGGPFPFGLCNFGESLGPRPIEVVYTTVAAVTLLGRRRWPVQTLLAIASASVLIALIWVASPGLGYFLPLLVAAYSVGRYHRGRHPGLSLLGAAVIVFATNVVHDLRVPGQSSSGSLATFYLVLLGALPMGRALQTQDLRAELAAAEAREARLAQDAAAQRAVQEERARIARELHDVAAHGASLIVVQSVAAQGVFDSDPARVRSALESIESEARSTLNEMRSLLGGLRPGQGEADWVESRRESMEELVARVRAAGQPVEAQLECAGRLAGDLEQTMYRCLQEALTNAVKHAPGARTTVTVRCAKDHVDLDVDNGPPARPPVPGTGGRGLAGMRERVTMLGGTIAAGPTAAGGFRLGLSIPIGDVR